jgi:hypothetical protein
MKILWRKPMNLEKFMNDLRDDILRIGNRAVKEAQKESLKKGIPNVYMLNNTIFFQLPNGKITSKIPEIFKTKELRLVID